MRERGAAWPWAESGSGRAYPGAEVGSAWPTVRGMPAADEPARGVGLPHPKGARPGAAEAVPCPSGGSPRAAPLPRASVSPPRGAGSRNPKPRGAAGSAPTPSSPLVLRPRAGLGKAPLERVPRVEGDPTVRDVPSSVHPPLVQGRCCAAAPLLKPCGCCHSRGFVLLFAHCCGALGCSGSGSGAFCLHSDAAVPLPRAVPVPLVTSHPFPVPHHSAAHWGWDTRVTKCVTAGVTSHCGLPLTLPRSPQDPRRGSVEPGSPRGLTSARTWWDAVWSSTHCWTTRLALW